MFIVYSADQKTVIQQNFLQDNLPRKSVQEWTLSGKEAEALHLEEEDFSDNEREGRDQGGLSDEEDPLQKIIQSRYCFIVVTCHHMSPFMQTNMFALSTVDSVMTRNCKACFDLRHFRWWNPGRDGDPHGAEKERGGEGGWRQRGFHSHQQGWSFKVLMPRISQLKSGTSITKDFIKEPLESRICHYINSHSESLTLLGRVGEEQDL